MATTNDYLNQLKIDKQNLVENLVAKGVNASSDETFTTLVPKIKDIQSGGDLNEYFTETITGSTSNVSGWQKTIKKLPAFKNTGTTCQNMFYQYQGTSLDLSGFDTSNVTNMNSMFSGCESLTSLDLSGINTSNVTNISYMFGDCKSLTSLDLSGFDTSKVTDISSMFYSCKNLAKIDMRSFEFANISSKNGVFGNNAYYGVPNNCEIIVKDDANKTWITTNYSRLTNVKTVAELES